MASAACGPGWGDGAGAQVRFQSRDPAAIRLACNAGTGVVWVADGPSLRRLEVAQRTLRTVVGGAESANDNDGQGTGATLLGPTLTPALPAASSIATDRAIRSATMVWLMLMAGLAPQWYG